MKETKELRSILDSGENWKAIALLELKQKKISLKNEDLTTYYVARALNQAGVLAFHIPNGGKRHIKTGAKFKAMGTMPGVADMCVIGPDGRTLWLELKDGANKQSESQQLFEKRIRLSGQSYDLAYNLEEAIRSVVDWLEFRD